MSEKELRDFYWEWLLHIDNDFSNRNNYFLVAESMLMAAFGAAYDQAAGLVLTVFATSGVLMSGIWLYSNHMVRSGSELPVKEALGKLNPGWEQIRTSRQRHGPFHLFVGSSMPALFFAVWLILLLFVVPWD